MEKILVIGDIILDKYLIGNIERISPEAPVPVVNVNEEKFVLGGAGNVMNNLLAFGINADIMSVIGKNDNTPLLLNLLKKKNINIHHVFTEENRPITIKTRILSSNQQIVRYDEETIEALTNDSVNKLLDTYKNIIKDYSIVILSDYGKGVLSEALTQKIISLANQENVKVLVDPKGHDYSKYKNAYLLTPNKREASIATGITIDNDFLNKAIHKLKSDYHLTYSIITLNQEGIALYDDTLKIFPTQTKEVYDVTGAGDTVIAAIAYKLAKKDSIEDAIEFANLAAGIVIGKAGAATATIDEIHPKKHNIKTKEEIKAIAYNLKQQGKRIVFTNGCFDILHLGHINYLEKAKELGDILIVGVNTDRSAKQLKGNDRPINPEFDRAYLLNALKVVDYTVLFDEETPYELIKIIQPDVLVKGGDYKNKEVIGSDLVEVTKIINFIEGKSTTTMINKIRQ